MAYNLALIYRDRKERDEAMRWLRRAVDTNPADRHARSLLKRLREDGS
ncbi:MAG: tetratricopeptide repeat protein [Chloroflexota bacterium]